MMSDAESVDFSGTEVTDTDDGATDERLQFGGAFGGPVEIRKASQNPSIFDMVCP